MEAGYDYLLVRSRFRNRLLKLGAISLVVLGLLLLGGGISFFAVFSESTKDLKNELDAVAEARGSGQPPGPQEGELASAREDATPTPEASPSATATPSLSATPSAGPSQVELVQAAPERLPASVISTARLYPGEDLRASYWSNPVSFEPLDAVIKDILRGFGPVDQEALPQPGTLPAPTQLVIPSIDVDSAVSELGVLDLGDSTAYETPKNIVGHIPETANPGESGTVWLFGHLESPLRNEGNVFAQLPKIPSLLRKGESVYAIVENGQTSYLYQVKETVVVPQDELTLHDTGSASLVMVTCVPRFIYDHRLVVSAELVGVKGLGGASG